MPSFKIFLFGLDQAGKTALSNFIKEKKETNPRPTLSFNVGQWIIRDLEFQIWDAPGQISLRYVWDKGFDRAKIMIFVLDSSKPERFPEAKQELDKVLQNLDTRGIPLIFCFHKMDLPNAKENITQAREILKLLLITDRYVKVFHTSVKMDSEVEAMKSCIVEIIEKNRWDA